MISTFQPFTRLLHLSEDYARLGRLRCTETILPVKVTVSPVDFEKSGRFVVESSYLMSNPMVGLKKSTIYI